MLKITLAGTTMDISNNQLSIVQTSPYPLVATSTPGGNYIFNFNLPATEDLKRIFKFYHRPQAKDHSAEVPFRIDADGLVYEGMAKVTEASARQYEIFCPVGNGNFNVASKNLKLTELDLGGDRLIDFHQIFTIANLSAIVHRVHFSPNPFEETIIPHFSNVQIDTGPSLNGDGTQLTINSYSTISMTFNFIATIEVGTMTFNIYRNGQLFDSVDIIGNQQSSYILPASNGQVITWDLVLQSEEQQNGTHELDVLLALGTSLNVQANGAPFDPEARYPQSDYAVFPVLNPEVFASWDDDYYAIDNVSLKTLYSQYFTVINYFANNVFPYTMSGIVEGEEFTAGNIITPFPYIAYVIKRIAAHYNYKIENNPFEDTLKYCVLINHFCENKFLNKSSKLIALKEGFNLNDHVPEWTIYDFLKHLCNLFGMGYEVDVQKQVLTFAFLDDIMIDDTYLDISEMVVDDVKVSNDLSCTGAKITQKPPSDKAFEKVKSLEGLNFKGTVYLILPAEGELNDCYFVTKLNGYYAWKYDPETYQFGWVLHSRNFTSQVIIGDDPREVTTDLCPVMLNSPNLYDLVLGHPEDRQWLIPESQQASRFEGAPEMYQNKWTPLIAFYHGLFPDSKGSNYPFGSLDIFDMDGNIIPGQELSLRLDGSNGLYEKKWKRFIEWRIRAIPVKARIIPGRKFLQNLRFSKKLMINGVKYLLVEFRGNIGNKGPEVAELTLLAL